MLNIRLVPRLTSRTQIAIKIVELDEAEKNYNGFRIKVNDGEWLLLPSFNSDNYETSPIIIPNLTETIVYKFDGEAYFNGEWIAIQSVSLTTQDGLGYNGEMLPSELLGQRSYSGAIVETLPPDKIEAPEPSMLPIPPVKGDEEA